MSSVWYYGATVRYPFTNISCSLQAVAGTLFRSAMTVVCILASASQIDAQGVTTAGIRGSVRSFDGTMVHGARVLVRNMANGFTVESATRDGHFAVFGLESGGPYTIRVSAHDYLPEQREQLYLRLGEPLELHFILQRGVLPVDTLEVSAPRTANAHGGIATTLSDSLLQRLPSLNRDIYDFVRLVPQISTTIGFRTGLSGGGVGFRFNNFLINGVPERTAFANATTALSGGKSLPLDAVKEYQVLLAPYDVRYGDFAGALVNTVTKAGTNKLAGSAFAYGRNAALARKTSASTYERLQYGFSLSGPIVRDRLHFFIAPEWQHLTSPAEGPYLGQPENALPAVAVRASDIARIDSIMRSYHLVAGSAGRVMNDNPLANVFARFDASIPRLSSRAMLWLNYSRTESSRLSRLAQDTFSLSTHREAQTGIARTTSFQLHTELRRSSGGHNEFLISHDWRAGANVPDVRQPIVRVSVPSISGGKVTVNTGPPPISHGVYTRPWTINMLDHLTLPLGARHVLSLGFSAERFNISRRGLAGSYGSWVFSSLDNLAQGVADRYELAKDFGSASTPFAGKQYGIYVGDQWQVNDRVTLSLGMRGDVLDIDGHAPYNAEVDSIFGRRTDVMPAARLHISPRLGFSWDVDGSGRDQFRGGVGIFTGRPPLAWLLTALSSYGIGTGFLRCGVAALPPPPPFEPDYRLAPVACATGPGVNTNPRGDVDLLDHQLRMAQTLRASVAYDRRLPWQISASAEALLTRNISDFVFVNLNLAGPQAVDPKGRVLYGTFDATGAARAVLRSQFAEVIDLRNTARNHSFQIATRFEKQFSRGTSGVASYTFSRVRDVQTPLRTGVRGNVNWASRMLSGRHDDTRPGISLNDVPHRIIVAGTHRVRWHWPTELTLYYVGESGSPFTYRAWGSGSLGDLNADGSNANDPVYVPRNAADPTEILFSGLSSLPGDDNRPAAQAERISQQQAAFQQFIDNTPCLRRQRGHIVERNTCREPWFNTTVAAARQLVPIGGHTVEAELDIFNLLNLFNQDWGRRRAGVTELLEHVGQFGTGAGNPGQPVFRFNPSARRYITLQTESAYQLQVALRYRF